MAGAQFISFPIPGDQERMEEIGLLRQLDRQVCMITHSSTIAILDRLEAKGEAHLWADADHKLWGDITARGRKMIPPATIGPATHRHKKRGTEYVLIGKGKMQAEKWYRRHGIETASDVDMADVAIYQSVDDGSFWVRPIEEFEDGRLELIPTMLDKLRAI